MTLLLAQLDDSRLYRREEAAAILCMSAWTLRDMVTANAVDCVRLGKRKGVRFSAENIRALATKRIERAGERDDATSVTVAAADPLAEFAQLRGLKRLT